MNEQNTAVWEQRLGDSLNALAESEAPVPTVTVADVIVSGRHAIHRRRGHTALALSAVLVAATALTFGAVSIADHGVSTAPAGSSASPVTSGSDPAAPIIAFGWLPASLNGEYQASQEAAGPNFVAGLNPRGPGYSEVYVRGPGAVILTAGVDGPGSAVQPGLALSSAGTVQGHQAWWTSGGADTEKDATVDNIFLMWQYKPNAWASIYYHGGVDAATRTMLLKVANSLVIGPANASALPFRMTSLPAGMHADGNGIDFPQKQGAKVGAAALHLCSTSPCDDGGGLVISQQSTTWTDNLILGVGDAPQINPVTGKPIPEVTRTKEIDGTKPPSAESVTIDGHAATLWTNAKGATLTFTYGDAAALISAADTEYKALGGENGFLAFCDSLTWFGPNPAQWTTTVIG